MYVTLLSTRAKPQNPKFKTAASSQSNLPIKQYNHNYIYIQTTDVVSLPFMAARQSTLRFLPLLELFTFNSLK